MISEKDKSGVTLRRFSKGRFLGKGGFAKVYEFTDLADKSVWAGKTISKSTL